MNAHTCRSARGSRVVCGVGCRTPRALVPPRALAQRQRSQWAKDDSDASATVLVIKDRESRAILAHPVLREARLCDDAVDQAGACARLSQSA
eukprot:10018728-Alexandrium_andersonii.AAC.1